MQQRESIRSEFWIWLWSISVQWLSYWQNDPAPVYLNLREAHPASYAMRIGVLSPGLKRSEREADHLLLSSVEVKNEWSYTSASFIRLHGVDEDIFTFTSIINFQFVRHTERSALKWVKPVGFVFVLGGKSCIRSQSLRLLGNVASCRWKSGLSNAALLSRDLDSRDP